MKKQLAYIACLCMLLFACKGGNKNEHEGHDHGETTEQGSCEGHDHGHAGESGHADHDGHNHGEGEEHSDHEGHNHEAAASEAHADEIVFTKAQAEAVGLQVQDAKPSTFNFIIKTGGSIEAAQGDELTLVATSSGVVSYNKSAFAEGSPVRAGEVILSISAQGIVDGDPALKARAGFDAAKKELERAETLLKDTLISRKEYEQIRLGYENAKLAYQPAAKSYTGRGFSVSSGISGFVKSKLVGEGEYVTVGQPVAVISQNKRLQLKAEVSEKYYKSLASISSANFKTPYDNTLYKLADLKGRILSYGKSSSASSFYIPVTFEFDNIGQIIPGSFVEIYLLSSAIKDAIVVPLSAIIEEQGLYFVYLQLDEEGYRKQEVKTGDDNGDDIRIVSGLKEGDRVVTKGAYQVKLASTSSLIPEGHSHSH